MKGMFALELLPVCQTDEHFIAKFMQRFRCCSRTAQSFLARARADLNGVKSEAIRDVARILPGQYKDALNRAKKKNDVTGMTRVLDGMQKLVASNPEPPAENQETRKVIYTTYNPYQEAQYRQWRKEKGLPVEETVEDATEPAEPTKPETESAEEHQ